MIPKHIIDTIMETARIEEVVQDFVSLKKAGAELKALSPFSNEKTPSFYVVPHKQIFKDFSSGKGGNVVTFLMEHEQLSYPEALKYLAKKYHIEIPEEREISAEELALAGEKESLYIVLNYALDYFKKQLHESEPGRAIGLSYFEERGFREDTLEKFGLGFAHEGWNAFTDAALEAGYKEDYLIKAGLTKEAQNGKKFDMFRNRVIFPIHSMSGKVVAFAGRQLSKEDKGPKYLNSPETAVYHKSDVLYGMYFAKNTIRIEDKCFLVEGYTDVITLNQSGVENVVASSGTSLTEGQIRQIKRFTPNITVLYDGDPAGIKASQRGIDMILAQGMNVRLVIFPDGEDPDSYCKQVGGETFKEYIAENEKDFILFKSELLVGESGKDPLRKAEAVKSIVQSISLIPDPLKRTVFAQECASIMDVPEAVINAELNKERRKGLAQDTKEVLEAKHIAEQVAPKEKLEPHKAETKAQERKLINLLMRHGNKEFKEETVADFISRQINTGFEFSEPVYQEVLEATRKALEEEREINEDFFIQHEDPRINGLAADSLISRYKVSQDWTTLHEIPVKDEEENYIQDIYSALLHYKIRRIEMLIEENQESLKDESEDEAIDALMTKQMKLLEMRKKLTEQIGTTIIK